MKTDTEETVLLTDEQIKRINELCADPPEPTDYVRRYINEYRKKNETKTSKGS
jgi:hypothetical protein